MPTVKQLSLIALTALSASCQDSPVCLTYAEFGLFVYVEDSVTGANLARGSTVVARDGTYRDSVTVPNDGFTYHADGVFLAEERRGTYTVTVRRPAYADWVKANVRVTEDECHVRRVTLVAKLRPAP